MPIDLEGRLKHANSLLKAGKVGVRILARGDRLTLVATLPPKPESAKPYPHQQRIALGYRFNQIGIDRAVKDARVLSARLIEGKFTWDDYLDSKKPLNTFGDAVIKFCDDYRSKRLSLGQDASKINQTLKNNYLKYLDKLDKDKPIDINVLAKTLEQMPHTATRRLTALAYASMMDSVGLENNLRALAGGYSYSSVNPKVIPSDDQIAEVFSQIKSKRWRTIYALLAIYGLRDYEAFRLDLTDYPRVFVNKGKTKQERLVYPLYPEWADSWLDVDNLIMPKVNLDRSNLQLGRDVTTWFYRSIVPFNAYSLRHAWARRSIQFGWDLTLAAKQMGHSVKVHSDVYHAWLSEDVYKKAYQDILNNPDRPKAPS